MTLPPRCHPQGLHLNAFRGEPAISRFAWHFTTTHRSSLPFVTDTGSGLHARVPRASPCPWVDHLVSGRLNATSRPFGLGFPPAPAVAALTSLRQTTRRLILQKARRHHGLLHGSDRLEAHGFRLSFTPLAGVLFTFPSRYWFPIGRWSYLALGGGPPSFPPDFACRAVLTLLFHSHDPPSPTGLSPSPAARSSSLRLPDHHQASGRSPTPITSYNPTTAAPTASYAVLVWALPRSLAATRGILSFPQGTEMFQFPQFPSCLHRITGYNARWVAPFGDPWIISCQRFPRAFHSVATSFFGNQRLGIHRVLFIPVCSFTPCHVPRQGPCSSSLVFSQIVCFFLLVVSGSHALPLVKVLPSAVEPRGLEPRTSAVQGRRSPS